VTIRQAGSRSIDYRYDGAGRVIEIRLQDAGGTTTMLLGYTYDDNGNVSRIDDWLNGTWVTYIYDTQNQLVRESYSGGTVLTYTYDELGNRTSSGPQRR
jgi:YD repeat-containing protein